MTGMRGPPLPGGRRWGKGGWGLRRMIGMVGTTQEIKKTWVEGKAGEAPEHVQ